MHSANKSHPSQENQEHDSPEARILIRVGQLISDLSEDRNEIWVHPAFATFVSDIRNIIRNSH